MIQMVATAFGGVNGGPDLSGRIYSGVNSAVGTFGYGGNRGVNLPAAYLNYILFDKDFKVLDMGWKPAPDAAFTKERLFFPTMDIKQAGFLFVYLSYDNASNNFVYFDDLRINHQQTNVVQYNEYYAFGLSAPTSWTRENSKNDFLYNAGSELNISTGWYETPFRNYDPVIGRFTAIDPKATSYAPVSGYHYAFNNPVMFNDPSGADGQQSGPVLPQYNGGAPPGYYDPAEAAMYEAMGLTGAYEAMQYMQYQNDLASARQGDYWATKKVTDGVGGSFSRVVGYHYSYSETLSGQYIQESFQINEFETETIASNARLYLYFNGKDLHIIHNGVSVFNVPGVSGRPGEGGKFDYSVSNQKNKSKGPIPAGTYSVTPSGIQDIGFGDHVIAEVVNPLTVIFGKKTGSWPGGMTSWGSMRLWIEGSAYGRDGFSIHGGLFPGSAGCIDLTKNLEVFMWKLQSFKVQGSIPLIVEY